MRRAAVGVLVTGALFLAAMLHATGGRASLPLDDSFIYFQYAKQTAAGHFLSYFPGDPATTGTTSLPWMLLLSIGALLGMQGTAMIFFAMALGGAFFAATVHAAGEAQRALAPRKPGSERPGDLPVVGLPLAGALVLLSGPLLWGAWSGMEIPLFTAAITAAFLAFVRDRAAPAQGSAVALAALALVRPEGALLAGVAVVLWIVRSVFDAPARRGLGWAALPVAAALVGPAVAWIATGDPRSTGFVAKSLWAEPGTGLLDALRQAGLRAASLGTALFAGIAPLSDGRGLYAYQSEAAALWVPAGSWVLFLLGVLPAVARETSDRRPGPGTLAVLWIAGLTFATCLLEEPDAHFSRYQMPVLPVFLLFVAIGVGRIARVTRDGLAGFARIALGLRVYLGALSIASALFFAAAYGDNCADIERMQIRLGEMLHESLGADDRVAINDAGAIAYFSQRRTLDLIGLTTTGFAGLWKQGSEVLYEKLEALPPGQRPDWFCIFPNWFDFDGIGLLQRVGSVRLLRPSIVDAEKVLYRADWSRAGSGDAPHLSGGRDWRVVDRLDVADPDSERAHRFRFDQGGQGGNAGGLLRRAPFADDPAEIVDGARTVLGGVSFEIGRAGEGATALVVRTVAGLRERVHVTVDGGDAFPVEIHGTPSGVFHDQVIATIAPGAGPARVTIRVVDKPTASAPLVLAHVFTVVPTP